MKGESDNRADISTHFPTCARNSFALSHQSLGCSCLYFVYFGVFGVFCASCTCCIYFRLLRLHNWRELVKPPGRLAATKKSVRGLDSGIIIRLPRVSTNSWNVHTRR